MTAVLLDFYECLVLEIVSDDAKEYFVAEIRFHILK
jgi:hypothetical protein